MRTAKTDLTDLADVQADLSLRWARMPFCWFCHEAAPMCLLYYFLSGFDRGMLFVS